MKNKDKEIEWSDEQTKVIGEMISNSEEIGWTQGHDDAIKEIIKEVEIFLFELKKKFFMRQEK